LEEEAFDVFRFLVVFFCVVCVFLPVVVPGTGFLTVEGFLTEEVVAAAAVVVVVVVVAVVVALVIGIVLEVVVGVGIGAFWPALDWVWCDVRSTEGTEGCGVASRTCAGMLDGMTADHKCTAYIKWE